MVGLGLGLLSGMEGIGKQAASQADALRQRQFFQSTQLFRNYIKTREAEKKAEAIELEVGPDGVYRPKSKKLELE